MLREEPVMAFDVFNPELAFPIHRDVYLFDDHCSGGLHAVELRIEVLHENGERLGAKPERLGTFLVAASGAHHDVGVAEMELCALDGIAVAIVLDKSEDAGEPGDGGRQIFIHDVRQNDIRRHGAVVHSEGL
jgi:hypothetical protein